jgi:hypothetical protein
MTRSSCLIIQPLESMVATRALPLVALLAGVASVPVSAQEFVGKPGSAQTFSVRAAVVEMPVEGSASPGTVRRDDQVVPAGAHFMHGQQYVCPPGGCGRGAHCQGTCVVRPGRFGFYATQWRKWPGDNGVQQASLQEMTPVSPPASAIPAVDEEALMPSSLMPDNEDAGFGSDNFGFEEVVPTPQAPLLPPAELPGGEETLPGGDSPGPTEGDAGTKPDSGNSSLFDEAMPPQKPSLFDEPVVPPAEQSPSKTPADDDKPEESVDNLFDDFGRASQLENQGLRQRLAIANQRLAVRLSQQGGSEAASSEWRPRELVEPLATRPLSRAGFFSRPSDVVPASAAERKDVRSNPLR